jgi:chemotaxis protein MotB
LAAVGYGHVKPLVPPDRPGSQWLNKRVDIVVVSGISEESRQLLGQVLEDQGLRPDGAGTTSATTTHASGETTREEKP